MRSDLAAALRLLRREPALSLLVILTLALGIAANAAIFSVVNGVLLEPLAYREPGRLIALQEHIPKLARQYPMIPVNAPAYLAWKQQARSLAGVALVSQRSVNLTGNGEPALLDAAAVSANLLPLLGVTPRLGRDFLANADQEGHDHEAILTDALWRNRFGADPNILGRAISLNGTPYDVIGVLPRSFRFPKGTELSPFVDLGPGAQIFIPKVFNKDELTDGGEFNYAVIARLKPGVTPAAALAELNLIQAGINRRFPEMGDVQVVGEPLRDMMVGAAERGLWLLLAAVLALLLIVCVNLANLLLARATSRRRETAIRGALGARPGQLLRQALTETVVLALIGGAIGLVLARAALALLLRAAPPDLPRLDNVRLDGMVLWFTCAVSVAAGLLAGALPAWRMAQGRPQEALRSSGARAGEAAAGRRAREALVGFETALTAGLLIVAGLLLASFTRLMNVPKGFSTARLLTASLVLPTTRYTQAAQREEFWRRALAAAAALPGVSGAAMISNLPLSGNSNVNPITVPGDTRPIPDQPLANTRQISPNYFRLLGIPLLAGRELTDADQGKPVAVISASAAAAAWPGRNALGQVFRRGPGNDPPIRVVGIVANTRGISLLDPPGLMVYQPYTGNTSASLLVRTAAPPAALAPELRRAIWQIDAGLPVPAMQSMDGIVAASLAPRRFQMLLVALFAGAALLLACLGIYGVVSYSVVRRTQELGVRVALGARPAHLYALILRQGLTPVAIGLFAGLLGALALGRALASLLFEMSPGDPRTLGAVVIVLGVVALAACWLPARRAVRSDPVTALRIE